MTDRPEREVEGLERIAKAKPGKIFLDGAQLHHLAVDPDWFADMQTVCSSAADALRTLTAERDRLEAENGRLREALDMALLLQSRRQIYATLRRALEPETEE